MKTLKSLERLQQLHILISREKTGTPDNLANLMSISKRSVHFMLEQLKDYEAPLRYCRSRKTYYYTDNFDLQISISVKIIHNDKLFDIFGGSYFLKKITKLQGLCSEPRYL